MASSKPQSGFNTVKTECYAPSYKRLHRTHQLGAMFQLAINPRNQAPRLLALNKKNPTTFESREKAQEFLLVAIVMSDVGQWS
ncbi:hypothetical protein Moror_8202 [Moniliophthora roreri MCA 2997]|uniref:Uncharacterized protein n=1 Tax=Moniliophthora roreri (strain MCA 2997) TaxID=1381753 RepID=V2XKS6_MONRO|nr:hypothetical protein Moror_8202 [Moniliophthora roreri MCA 2997]